MEKKNKKSQVTDNSGSYIKIEIVDIFNYDKNGDQIKKIIEVKPYFERMQLTRSEYNAAIKSIETYRNQTISPFS